MRTVKRRSLRIKQEQNMKALALARQTMIYINSKMDTSKSEPIEDVSEFLPFPGVWALFTSEDLISPTAAKEFTACIRYFNSSFLKGFESEVKYVPLIPDM